MEKLNQNNPVHDDLLSEFEDPFRKDCVKAVHFHLYNEKFFNKKGHLASVEMVKGSVEAEHKFKDANKQNLFKRVQAYIDELPEK